MIILRSKLFNKISLEDEEKKTKVSDKEMLKAAGVGALAAGSTLLGSKYWNASLNKAYKLKDEKLPSGSDATIDDLRRIGRAMYKEVGVKNIIDSDNSSYYSPESDIVVLGPAGNNSAHLGTLSHELGHASSVKGNSVSNKVGRILHKGRLGMLNIGDGLLDNAALLNSVRSGIHSARQERKGKKEGLLSKHSTWILPTLKHGIILGSEYDATRNGLKLLKKHGASDELIKRTAQANGITGALGTYAGRALKDISANVLARQGSKILTKAYYKWWDSMDSDEEDDVSKK